MPATFNASSFPIFPNCLFTVFTREIKLDLSLAAQGFPALHSCRQRPGRPFGKLCQFGQVPGENLFLQHRRSAARPIFVPITPGLLHQAFFKTTSCRAASKNAPTTKPIYRHTAATAQQAPPYPNGESGNAGKIPPCRPHNAHTISRYARSCRHDEDPRRPPARP